MVSLAETTSVALCSPRQGSDSVSVAAVQSFVAELLPCVMMGYDRLMSTTLDSVKEAMRQAITPPIVAAAAQLSQPSLEMQPLERALEQVIMARLHGHACMSAWFCGLGLHLARQVPRMIAGCPWLLSLLRSMVFEPLFQIDCGAEPLITYTFSLQSCSSWFWRPGGSHSGGCHPSSFVGPSHSQHKH